MNSSPLQNNDNLTWLQPNTLRRAYELHAGSESIASLKWEKQDGKPQIIGQVGGRQWSFSAMRLLYPRVIVRDAETGELTAAFTAHLNGKGTVEVASGHRFRWISTDFWGTEWGFASLKGQPFLYFVPDHSLFKFRTRVEIKPGARLITDWPVLLLLGWYLTLQMMNEGNRFIVPSREHTAPPPVYHQTQEVQEWSPFNHLFTNP